jgi:predicted PurR-regulated permease PerM
MADNLLRPRMVGSRTRLHELVVFFSVLGGINVFGVLGIIAGPVVIAMTTSFLDVLRRVDEDSAVAAPVKAGDVTS